jgi:hypothetical protein
MASAEPREQNREGTAACCGALELKLPNAGRQHETVIIFNFGTPQRRFGADHWTGQASNQRSTPSYVERWLQGEARKGKTGSHESAHSRSGGAGLATNRRTIFDN